MGMGSAQAINAAWLTAKMEDHKRPVALAAYVMSIQLANFPGNQLFRAKGTSTITVRAGFGNADCLRCSALPAWIDYCSLVCYRCCSCDSSVEGVVSIV